MHAHLFLFHPGTWIGEGTISFNASAEVIRFYTKWQIGSISPVGIACTQEVEMQGTEPNMMNAFFLSHITPQAFTVEIENELFGKVEGKGIIDPRTIAWEFHSGKNLEGFEVYTLQDNGEYKMHAEYASTDQFRTLIEGRIWQKPE